MSTTSRSVPAEGLPRHRSGTALLAALDHVRAAPSDQGTLKLVVARPEPGARLLLDTALLDPATGLVGDDWAERGSRTTADGSADPLRQITVMNYRMVALLADTAQQQALAGDQLYVDLDLSVANLPAGTRLAVGSAVIEVTRPPHTGCAKFVARFGSEAMQFVNGRPGRALRLRGLNARVATAGPVGPGDAVRKL